MLLGSGIETKDIQIDYSAGIILRNKVGKYVEKGEVLATLYANNQELFKAAEDKLIEAFTIEDNTPKERPLILARIEKDKIVKYV